MKNFLTITNEFQLQWNEDWIKDVGFTIVGEDKCLLVEFENQFYVTYMTLQSGQISWAIVHTPIDGYVKIEHSTVSRHRDIQFAHKRLTNILNDAMARLTSDWIECYQPK